MFSKILKVTLCVAVVTVVGCKKSSSGDKAVDENGACTQATIDASNALVMASSSNDVNAVINSCNQLQSILGNRSCQALNTSTYNEMTISYTKVASACEDVKRTQAEQVARANNPPRYVESGVPACSRSTISSGVELGDAARKFVQTESVGDALASQSACQNYRRSFIGVEGGKCRVSDTRTGETVELSFSGDFLKYCDAIDEVLRERGY